MQSVTYLTLPSSSLNLGRKTFTDVNSPDMNSLFMVMVNLLTGIGPAERIFGSYANFVNYRLQKDYK